MTITIYHNPKCSKSREALNILEEAGLEFAVKEYLKEGLNHQEILDLAKKLDMSVSEFIRVKEDEFKQFKIDWSDDHVAAKALCSAPKLLERPIVINGDKAIVARPPEKLKHIL